jgi:hypothetical protein
MHQRLDAINKRRVSAPVPSALKMKVEARAPKTPPPPKPPKPPEESKPTG